MFTIEMLPAGYGDCLWIEYGNRREPHRVLIDGGLAPTYDLIRARIEELPADERHFELLIITHVDADHIEGAVRLLGSTKTLGLSFGDVWFNGYQHLPEDDRLGPAQGEYLSALIQKNNHPWNLAFHGEAVIIPDEGPLPRCELPGGLTLTLLSPTTERLADLRGKWDEEIARAGLDRDSVEEVLAALEANKLLRPDDDRLGDEAINIEQLADVRFKSDTAEANGSSIAVLAEYDKRVCLLTGDAWAPLLAGSIRRLLEESGDAKLEISAFKLPHHGSRANISAALLDLLSCDKYLFSTNGKKFNHPDREGVARAITHGGREPSLFFNYTSDLNKVWNDPRLMEGDHPFKTYYPETKEGGILIEL